MQEMPSITDGRRAVLSFSAFEAPGLEVAGEAIQCLNPRSAAQLSFKVV